MVKLNQDGKPSNAAIRAWRNIIGYEDTEANRVGVPYVSSKEWLGGLVSNPKSGTLTYLDSLFPFTKWILSYNLSWAVGDIIAGFTVGLVVIPQSMSYAKIAGLAPEFGLYSSFVGVMIYALFATSKDVTIGPVAVMSLQTGNVIRNVVDKVGPDLYRPEVIASALAFLCGIITLGVGLLRIGWIVEFIPAPAVSGFMTGSAIVIVAGQVPKLLGLNVVTNGPSTYKIIINTFKQLPNTTIDAAFGIVGLFGLYLIRYICTALPRRYPKFARAAFFASVFRSAFVIIVLTAASRIWLGGKNPKTYPISILKTVPSGFKHIGQPDLSTQLFSDLASELPVSVIILLLEHIAIARSFGRLGQYRVDPDQELCAIGVTNLVGPCFGAYAATGSFSRSAIKAKSGVRTPLAGWITGIIVLVALYALTGTFYWIPNAGLSAVIIHAVIDLIAPPSALYKFWLVSPLEFFIWAGAVLLTIFQTVEIGVYFSVGASLALLLIRIARPRGKWLGLVRIHHGDARHPQAVAQDHRDVFVPLDDPDGLRDPSVHVSPPPPGVLIYRFEEAFTYPNAAHVADIIINRAKDLTRPGRLDRYAKRGDRPWNDPGPVNPHLAKFARGVLCGAAKRRAEQAHLDKLEADRLAESDPRPLLRAFIFDFGSVANVDTTSIQSLVDVRNTLERYADAEIEWHIAGILSPWIRRGLLAGGFGTGNARKHITEVAPVVNARQDGLSIKEALARDEEEAERRARAIDNALREGRSTQYLRPRNNDLSELEAGLAGDRDATRSAVNVPTLGAADPLDPNSINVAPHVRIVAGSTSSATDDDLKHPESDDASSEENHHGGLNDSRLSVPVLWNHSHTPFFHLDLNSALAATQGRDPTIRS